jgi:hypothetical protein
MKKLLSLLIILSLNACAYSTHLVHVGGFDKHSSLKSGKVVSAETEQFVILGFKQDINYVDNAYQNLQNKCKGGSISGITTTHSTDLGFFSWTNRIRMRGRCYRS